MPPITLLTDFGTADGYVGEMKGVILSLASEVPIIDISHEVPAHDVDAARLAVARYWRRFPAGVVHVVVVDPGVGTDRAAIAVASAGRFLVGPDNGALSPAMLRPGAHVVRLPIPAGASATFHGRDVFAPAAARLATGVALDDLGPSMAEPIIRRTPEARRLADGTVAGEVIAMDRFGNLVTNLVAPHGGSVSIGGRSVGEIVRTYADAPPGGLVALVGSTGLVEVAHRDGSAARELGAARGTPVLLTPLRPHPPPGRP
ncbi:MAG: SAM-dependent chlorinase/fluorinase [Gemmatimonadota bacterium]|nr:SAM-dependent chlorinase/fluorinase [Gemmatimonadota bacterium]